MTDAKRLEEIRQRQKKAASIDPDWGVAQDLAYLLSLLDEARFEAKANAVRRDAWEHRLRLTCEYVAHGEDGQALDLKSLRARQSPEPGDMQLSIYSVLSDLWQEREKQKRLLDEAREVVLEAEVGSSDPEGWAERARAFLERTEEK